MKRFIAALVTAALVLTLCCNAVSADYARPDDLNGVKNVFLSYTLASNKSDGRRTVQQYKPIVGYYDQSGKLVDSYFDTFLFLPCVTQAPSGGYTYYSTSKPNNFSDWQAFVDDCFMEGYNIPALNQAVAEFKREMGEGYKNYKAKVFLTCIYPVQTQRNFGDVDGDGITEDFSKYADRVKALNWMVNEQLSRFYGGKYENLELVGFYWFEETVYNETYGRQIIKDFNSIIHSKQLKTIWIPYYTASSKEMWRTLGFDVACLQPNYMFYDVGERRVNDACAYAKANGMCLEIESFGDVLKKAEYYNRYIKYLEGCIKNGADKGIKMYYNDGGRGVYYNAYQSQDKRARGIYDLTYKFAKGILKTDELSYIEQKPPFDLNNYEVVTKGKPYTASRPYTDSEMDYADNDGKELTDGTLGKSSYGTEWHSFHFMYQEPSGGFEVTIDLGETVKDLNFFVSEFQQGADAGIGLPSAVYYEVSTDGKNFTLVGRAEISDNDWSYDYTLATLRTEKYYSARYIRARISLGSYNFVFCSEVAAGRTEKPTYPQYKNVSLGKAYTATASYTDTNMPYGNCDGNELTDGVYGTLGYGSEWHAFNVSNVAKGQPYKAEIDLGSMQGGICILSAHFEKLQEASIGLPESVAYYASEDGSEYKFLGRVYPVSLGGDMYEAMLTLDRPVAARYIRAEIGRGNLSFVFCSEISVLQENMTPPDVSDVSNESSESNESTESTESTESGEQTEPVDERLAGRDVYYGLSEKTTLDAFNDNFLGTYTAKSLPQSGFIATGTLLTSGVHSFTAVIMGDLDSDGLVSPADCALLKEHLLMQSSITDEYSLSAANIDGLALNALDYMYIKRHIKGVHNIYGGLSQ